MCNLKQKRLRELNQIALFLTASLLGFLTVVDFAFHSQARNGIEISANFVGKELAPGDRLEFRLNRSLGTEEGSLAFVLNKTDLTAFVVPGSQVYSYAPKSFPLPAGENKLTIYLVNPRGEWTQIKEFILQVAGNKGNDKTNGETETSSSEIKFTPNVLLNFKGESNVGFFPESSRPARLSYTDAAGQGSFQISLRRNGWSFGSQFDFAGSSFQQEALRFGELGEKAPPIDLSSYLVEVGKGRFKAQIGHVSFGSQRHLINSFSSRGLSVTVPVSRQNEVSFSVLNGTSIVGFDNFTGITRANHQVLGATFAREFFKERPGGLRLELTAMRGSLLPLNSFNERNINDAEKSYGGAIRLQFKDKKERLRFEGGFTRSRFTNPRDPNLERGEELTPIRAVSRNARYGEISFDFLQGLKVWKERKLKLTGTYRHEEIEPLFRSVVAAAQADRRQNQFEVAASLGEINFTFGNLRDRDNLTDIISILKTLSRRRNFILSVPLNLLVNQAKPVKWLPRVAYSYDHFHQFGVFLPADGGFDSLSQVPDQHNYAHNFNAEWSLSEKLRFGYRYNRSFQDNRQTGRELADFLTSADALTIGAQFHKNFDLNFDLSRERAANFEQPRTDNTFRFGTNLMWREALMKNLTFNTNFSTVIAGDRAKTTDAENIEFDAQLAYRFEFGKNKYKKMNAQVFVRYANRYGSRLDRIFLINEFNKNQGFNMGLSFNFF